MMIMTTFLTITLSWLFLFLFINVAFSFSTPASYDEHCSSVVPQSIPTSPVDRNPVPDIPIIFFLGGGSFQRKQPSIFTDMHRSLGFWLNPWLLYETVDKGIYKINGYLSSRYEYFYNGESNYSYGSYYHRSAVHFSSIVTFELNGFWSESSRELCMIGSASRKEEGDKASEAFNVHDGVLKLKFASKAPTMFTSIVSGTLTSTDRADDSRYFTPVSIISIPPIHDYNYSVASQQLGDQGLNGDIDIHKNESLVLVPGMFLRQGDFAFQLEYAADWNTPNHCSLLPARSDGFIPQSVSLSTIQSSRDERNIRYVMTFENAKYSSLGQNFDINATFVAEGTWDDRNNRLFIVACQLLNPSDYTGWNVVGDCSLMLSLRFPSTWTIRKTRLVGQIWTNKSVHGSGDFENINLKVLGAAEMLFLGYTYTEFDRVRELCNTNKHVKKHDIYPRVFSNDMRFDMHINSSTGLQFAWGYAQPLSVENELFDGKSVFDAFPPAPPFAFSDITASKRSSNSVVNISYSLVISLTGGMDLSTRFPELLSLVNYRRELVINAEGVYNAETGHLCMVGCRELTNWSFDCDIVVNIDFAPLNERSGFAINGIIQSTRRKGDPLRFDKLSLSSAGFSQQAAENTIWRMDLEIALVLISRTLICIFVAIQTFHAKRNPKVLSGISLVMIVILILGLAIPLVLDEDLFSAGHDKQSVMLSIGGWNEAYEVTMWVVTTFALLLHIRLFQLVWSAKMNDANDNWRSWIGEKNAIFVSLPVYILGGLVTLLLNRIGLQRYFHVRTYFGLIVDGFLLPQIVLNALAGSMEKPLAHPFYIGTSMVRLVPHAYDQYRAHNYPTTYVNGTYYYANRYSVVHSTVWNVTVSSMVVVFAVILFLQQRRGGRWILPKRLRELELHGSEGGYA